jgi:hypothetical protein
MLRVRFPGPEVFTDCFIHERHQALPAGVLEPLRRGFSSVQAES